MEGSNMSKVKDAATIKLKSGKYKIQLLSTSRAFVVGQEIMKLTLPSAGAAADGFGNMEAFGESQTWQAIAIHLLGQMEAVDTLDLIQEILEDVECDGKEIDFDDHFKGNLGQLMSVIEFALKENFGSLFTDSSLIQKLQIFMQGFKSQSRTQEPTEDQPTEQEKSSTSDQA